MLSASKPLAGADHSCLLWQLVPILGSLGLVLLVVLCPNPPRGGADTHRESLAAHSPYMEDIKYLLKK